MEAPPQMSREGILNSIRRSLAVTGAEDSRRKTVAERMAAHRPNLIPERGKGDSAHRLALFVELAEEVSATVQRVESLDELPSAIQGFLRAHNLPQAIRHGADPLIDALPWQQHAPTLERRRGRAVLADETSLSHAFAGVAETGTLILHSGPDNPTTLNFLPDNHIVILAAADIAGTYEEVWDRLRRKFGERNLPRTVNMITGPSRTGDVEQTIELGAHGPRRLHILIVENL
jgi:L-lactate dehydrogenase complex protein LldG